jgi:hypothetical protein
MPPPRCPGGNGYRTPAWQNSTASADCCARLNGQRGPLRDPRGGRSGEDRDEPAPRMENLSATKFGGELCTVEESLIHAVDRTVVERALLPFLAVNPFSASRVDDYQLRGDAPCLGQEGRALCGQQMSVRVAREDAADSPEENGKGTASPSTTSTVGHATASSPASAGSDRAPRPRRTRSESGIRCRRPRRASA